MLKLRARSCSVVQVLGAVVVLWLWPSHARAFEGGDGAYGRFDRGLTLAFVLAGGAARSVGGWEGTGALELRARWIDAAGPFVSARWGPTSAVGLVLGIELRPLWPSLFFLGLSTGLEWVDLALQSLGVDLGVLVAPLGQGVGVAFAWGLGLELPLVVPSLSPWGPWLRLAFRHAVAPTTSLSGPAQDRSELAIWAGFVVRIGVGPGRSFAVREPPRYR